MDDHWRAVAENANRLRALSPIATFEDIFDAYDQAPHSAYVDGCPPIEVVREISWLVGYLEGVAATQEMTKLELLSELGILSD